MAHVAAEGNCSVLWCCPITDPTGRIHGFWKQAAGERGECEAQQLRELSVKAERTLDSKGPPLRPLEPPRSRS